MSGLVFLEKYKSFFHDGSLIKINILQNNDMDFFVESAEIDNNDCCLNLSPHNTIMGIIHLRNVNSIIINDEKENELVMHLPEGEIMHLSVASTSFNIEILWHNPSSSSNGISNYENIEISCDNVDWEFMNFER